MIKHNYDKFEVPVIQTNYIKASLYIVLIGAPRGSQGTPRPQNGSNCSRKMMLFQKDLFLATPFPKIVRNPIFLFKFSSRIFFVQMRKKSTQGFKVF